MNELDVIKAYTYQVYTGTTLKDDKIPYFYKGKDIVEMIDDMFLHNPNSTFSYKKELFDDEKKVKNFAYSLAYLLRHIDCIIQDDEKNKTNIVNTNDFKIYPYEVEGTYYPMVSVSENVFTNFFVNIIERYTENENEKENYKKDFEEFKKKFNVKEHLEKYSDSYNANEEYNNYNSNEDKIIIKDYLTKMQKGKGIYKYIYLRLSDIDMASAKIEDQISIQSPNFFYVDNFRGITKNSNLHFNKTKKLNIKSEGDLDNIL